jgi:large subunit ribosomal protein L22
MQATSRAKDIRISPRKMRLVVDLIRGRKVEDALVILQNTEKKAAPMVEKILRSAVANALYVAGNEATAPRVNVDDLVVQTAFVDGAGFLKRFRPRPMGRANRIRKRSSHVTIVVGPAAGKRTTAKRIKRTRPAVAPAESAAATATAAAAKTESKSKARKPSARKSPARKEDAASKAKKK